MPVNTVNINGDGNTVSQTYVTGHISSLFLSQPQLSALEPFSLDWLLYSQVSVPFFGREDELKELSQFLSNDASFLWWTIVGEGGAGKSRLAFELAEQSKPAWTGGFIDKNIFSASNLPDWEPREPTLFIIDYAAEYANRISNLIQALQHKASADAKIRLLLLERHASGDFGWFGDIQRSYSVAASIARQTCYRPPLLLHTLGPSSIPFLENIASALPPEDALVLRSVLPSIDADWLARNSNGGNSLMLLLLAHEFIHNNGDLTIVFHPRRPVIESFVHREIGKLREVVSQHELSYVSAALLLFCTTSSFPLLTDVDGEVGLTLKEGDADASVLFTLCGIDDYQAYLRIFEERGFSSARSWSLQPDLLGETLISFILNSSAVSQWLRQKRPNIKKEQLTNLIGYLTQVGLENTSRNWSRLAPPSLYALLEFLYGNFNSVRYILMLIKSVNHYRNAKLPFNPAKVFLNKKEKHRSTDVYNYYRRAVDAIGDGAAPVADAPYFANAPHAWILSYIDSINDITIAQRLALVETMAACRARSHLLRRTNLTNDLNVMSKLFRGMVSGKTKDLYLHYRPRLSTKTIPIVLSYLDEIVVEIFEREEDELGQDALASVVISCSYALLQDTISSTDLDREAWARVAKRTATVVQYGHEDEWGILIRNQIALRYESSSEDVAYWRECHDILNLISGHRNMETVVGVFTDYLSMCARSGRFLDGLGAVDRLITLMDPVARVLIEPALGTLLWIASQIETDLPLLGKLSRTALEVMSWCAEPEGWQHFQRIIYVWIASLANSVERDPVKVREFLQRSNEFLAYGNLDELGREGLLQAVAMIHGVYPDCDGDSPFSVSREIMAEDFVASAIQGLNPPSGAFVVNVAKIVVKSDTGLAHVSYQVKMTVGEETEDYNYDEGQKFSDDVLKNIMAHGDSAY